MTTGIHKIDFSSPDEVRAPEKTTMEIVNVGSTKVARLTAQPGLGLVGVYCPGGWHRQLPGSPSGSGPIGPVTGATRRR